MTLLSALGAHAVSQPMFNAASGGTTADVSNYLGTGKTWRTHTFTGNGTLTVTNSAKPWSVLCVGGGGVGIGTYGGEGGQVVSSTSATLSVGAISVVVGSGGATVNNGDGAAGGDSYVSGVLTAYGARSIGSNTGTSAPGGAGNRGANAGGSPSGNYGGAGGVGVSSDVSGTATYYGGGGGGQSGDGGIPNSGGNGGAGGGGHGNPTRQNGTNGLGGGSGGFFFGAPKYGGSGVVVIAYQIS